MSIISAKSTSIDQIHEILHKFSEIPLQRIRLHPTPGTATILDVIKIHHEEKKLCELVEGVLVEKTMGFNESRLAIFLSYLLCGFVLPRNLGIVIGSDANMEILPDLVRIPDVSFISWDRIPDDYVQSEPIPRLVPNLAVEVLSISNTPREMAWKRQHYFQAGVQLVWEIDPIARTVFVYTSPTEPRILELTDSIDGGIVLPGFVLPVADLFAELDRPRNSNVTQ